MLQLAEQVIQRLYNEKPLEVKDFGGGFYGKVFLALLPEAPYKVIIKFHLRQGLCQREKRQLEELSKYALLKVPQIYFMYHADENIPYDALIMEYIEGQNAGNIVEITDEKREHIAGQIVDNLIALHKTVHKEGFGELGAEHFESEWKNYYKPQIDVIMKKADVLFKKERISEECFHIVEEAYEKFDKVFYLPITTASLIHGDYNTWNILLNQDATDAISVIDPYNCCYADSEFDLYQLNNANGKVYGLLDKYKEKQPVSENFELKMAYYELFTELMHYYDADVVPNKELVDSQAKRLKNAMDIFFVISK